MRWIIGLFIIGIAAAMLADHNDAFATFVAGSFVVAGLTVLPPVRRFIVREYGWRALALSTPVTVPAAFALAIIHSAMI